jgi:hypothetical protein
MDLLRYSSEKDAIGYLKLLREGVPPIMGGAYPLGPFILNAAEPAAVALQPAADLFIYTVLPFAIEVWAFGVLSVVDGGADAFTLALKHQPLGGAYATKATITVPSTYAAGDIYYNDQFQPFAANIGDLVKIECTEAAAATSTGKVFMAVRRSPKAKPSAATFVEVAS